VILDLFAGPGGWSEGLRLLGLDDVGIEWDGPACATRSAADHRTIRADVSQYPTEPFVGKVEGLIASPPCPDWSSAGKRAGMSGRSGYLVREVPRWVEALLPRWVACEQVPLALPVWREYAARFHALGYSVWTGLLNAVDYGVPQTRKRAILVASFDRPAGPPTPILAPPVTMAEAVGWTGALHTNRGQNRFGERQVLSVHRPAPSFTANAGAQWQIRETGGSSRTMADGGRKVSVAEALILQGFRPDYPVQGTRIERLEQIGNAVPPPLAAAVIGALVGHEREAAA